MKLIVAGGRNVQNREQVYCDLDSRASGISEIVSGMALVWLWSRDPEIGGPDRYGHDWAVLRGIPVAKFPAVWDYKGAGFERNNAMADYADAALIFWDGKSTGTADMIKRMKVRKKPVIVENCALSCTLSELFE
jgi:hypothetical protein